MTPVFELKIDGKRVPHTELDRTERLAWCSRISMDVVDIRRCFSGDDHIRVCERIGIEPGRNEAQSVALIVEHFKKQEAQGEV